MCVCVCVCVCVRERERERMSVCVMQAWLIVCSLVISSFVHACLRSLRPQFLVHTVAWLLRRRALHFIFMPLLEKAYAQLGELHFLPNVPPSELLPIQLKSIGNFALFYFCHFVFFFLFLPKPACWLSRSWNLPIVGHTFICLCLKNLMPAVTF